MSDKGAAPTINDDTPPMHPWNGTDDGHDCENCLPESIWKCDRPKHDELQMAYTRVLKETQKSSAPVLAQMQRTRRRALDDSLGKGLA